MRGQLAWVATAPLPICLMNRKKGSDLFRDTLSCWPGGCLQCSSRRLTLGAPDVILFFGGSNGHTLRALGAVGEVAMRFGRYTGMDGDFSG